MLLHSLRPRSAALWANRLQERVQYLIVQNATSPQSDFSYWDSAEQAVRFREALSPIVIRMEFRLAELENPARQHGIRLGQVATRQNAIDELKRASIVMRAESYRRRLFSEFDRAKEGFHHEPRTPQFGGRRVREQNPVR
jgi:hypothetical protein